MRWTFPAHAIPPARKISHQHALTTFRIPMSDTAYCYHCGTHHPKEEMRQIETKGGKRWRCIKSIQATKQGREEREAFGRQTTAINKAEAQSKKARLTLSLER